MRKPKNVIRTLLPLLLCFVLLAAQGGGAPYALAQDEQAATDAADAAAVDTPADTSVSEPAPADTPAATDVPVSTDMPTATDAPVATDVPAATSALTATDTPAPVDVIGPTPTPAAQPTATSAPAATESPIPEATPEATAAPTESPAPTEEAWTRTDGSPMDVRDVLADMGISPASIINRFAVQFKEDGQVVTSPTEDAEIKMTFHIHLPEGVPAQLRSGDTYSFDRPDTIVATGAHDIDLEAGGVVYAHVTVDDGPLDIVFTDAVQGLSSIEDDFSIQARFEPGAFAPGEQAEFSLPGEEAVVLTFTMASEDGSRNDDAENLPTLEYATCGPHCINSAGLVTGYTLAFLENGETTQEPTAGAEITATLTLSISEELAPLFVPGEVYMIALPRALRILEEQTQEVSTESGVLGTATIATNKNISIAFAEGADAMGGQSAILTFNATFDPAVVSAPGKYVLSLPNERAAPPMQITVAATGVVENDGVMTLESETLVFALDDATWTRTDDTPMDVKDIFGNLDITPASIVTGINLTFQEPGGGATSSSEASLDASINFDMSLAIPAAVTQNMREGDTYTITLPPEISVVQGGTYDLLGTDINGAEVSYGTVVVNTDGTIVITFHDGVQDLGDATGAFHFTAGFDKSEIDSPGDHVVQIPNEPEDVNQTVDIRSNVDQALEKSGAPDKPYNPSQIVWTVDFNKPMDTLQNAVLTDPMPSGLQLQDVQIYTIDVDVDGNVKPNSEKLYTGQYTIDPITSEIHFADPIDKAMRVVYTADITADTSSGGNISFVNEATLQTSDQEDLTTNATVTARYGDFLDKTSVGYDPETQEITWQIRYNYGEQLIPQVEANLTDVLQGEGMVFEQDSVVIQHVDIDANGAATPGAVLSDYTLGFDGDTMTISFNNDVHEAILITYKTKINAYVDQSGTTYSNDVSTTWQGKPHTGNDTKPVQQVNVTKSLYNIDDVNQRLTWVTHINASRYLMIDWSMTDTFGPGLHLVDDDLMEVVDVTDGVTLQRDTDYTVSIPNDGQFTVTFQGAYKAGTDHVFDIIYYSHYDVDAPSTVTNDVTVNWTDDGGDPHDSTTHVTYPRTPVDVNNGMKYGSYNAVTKEITWYILANYHVEAIRPGQLVDPIQGDQQYIPGSLKFYGYVQGLQPEQGAVIDAASVGFIIEEPSDSNNQTLTITYNGNDENQTAAVWGVFRTSLKGQFVGTSNTYDNHAVLTINDVSSPLDGSVSIRHGGELVDKSGVQGSDGYVTWTSTINASQSTLQQVVLTDTPSANQHIDMDSLDIFRTLVNEGGNISPNYKSPLIRDQDYTATYEPDDAGTWVLTIRFTGTVSTPYILRYRASVYLDNITGTVSNNLHLESTSDGVEHNGSTNTNTNVQISDGGGVLYGRPGALTVRKIDENGAPLADALLELEDPKGNRIGPVQVGQDGIVTFSNLVQGTYKLYELSAPAGYTVSQELAQGMTIVIDDDTTQGVVIPDIQNEQTEISLRKVNADGQPLEGAVFRLEWYDAAADAFKPYGTDTYTSGADGMVRVMGLWPGRYRFIEVTAPDGYLINDTPLEVSLSVGQQGIVGPAEGGDFVNHKVTLSLLKTNTAGTLLEGAVFALYDANGNELGRYTTGPDGTATIGDIAPGTYIIREVAAPIGYVLVTDPRQVTIPDSATGALPPLHLGTITNERAAGSVIFNKVDGDTGTGLAGAIFQVTNLDTGETVGQTTTNDTGWAEIDGLQPGNYRLEEIVAPDGYLRNAHSLDFTVTDASYGSAAPMDLGTFENYHGRVRIEKVDDNQDPVIGATFTLYDAGGAELGAYTTDTAGAIEIYELVPGTYTLRETATQPGYELVSDPYNFTIPDSADGELPIMRLGTAINQRRSGVAVVRKVDSETGVLLAGAVFELISGDTGELVATVTTDETGLASVSGLAAGDYYFIEIAAPEGYKVHYDVLPLTITTNGQAAAVEVISRDEPLLDKPPRVTLPPEGPPKTGDAGNAPFILLMVLSAFIFLSAFAIGWGIRKKNTGSR